MQSNTETITKEKIAEMLKANLGLSNIICEEITAALFTEIFELVKEKQKINLKNFGKFFLNHKNTRPGFNIRTGDLVEIPPRSVLRFVPSRKFKYKINQDVKK
ncbi:MAG: HU family DNA-binding protein [Rickettsiaceae bacterium]|nr:HU family DNA-binding protein [Rickettsiaceae bacterium]